MLGPSTLLFPNISGVGTRPKKAEVLTTASTRLLAARVDFRHPVHGNTFSTILNTIIQLMLVFCGDGMADCQRRQWESMWFTAHTFRRAGAQHRFMHVMPVANRWPLSQIKWWAGWCPGIVNVIVLAKLIFVILLIYPDRRKQGHATALPRRRRHRLRGGRARARAAPGRSSQERGARRCGGRCASRIDSILHLGRTGGQAQGASSGDDPARASLALARRQRQGPERPVASVVPDVARDGDVVCLRRPGSPLLQGGARLVPQRASLGRKRPVALQDKEVRARVGPFSSPHALRDMAKSVRCHGAALYWISLSQKRVD